LAFLKGGNTRERGGEGGQVRKGRGWEESERAIARGRGRGREREGDGERETSKRAGLSPSLSRGRENERERDLRARFVVVTCKFVAWEQGVEGVKETDRQSQSNSFLFTLCLNCFHYNSKFSTVVRTQRRPPT
jgi:hypothetical protein